MTKNKASSPEPSQPRKHELKMTPGHVNRVTQEVEPPWKCTVCLKYFHHRTDALTCKAAPPSSPSPQPSPDRHTAVNVKDEIEFLKGIDTPSPQPADCLRIAAEDLWTVKNGLMAMRDSAELTPIKEEWIAAKIAQWLETAAASPHKDEPLQSVPRNYVDSKHLVGDEPSREAKFCPHGIKQNVGLACWNCGPNAGAPMTEPNREALLNESREAWLSLGENRRFNTAQLERAYDAGFNDGWQARLSTETIWDLCIKSICKRCAEGDPLQEYSHYTETETDYNCGVGERHNYQECLAVAIHKLRKERE